MGVTFKFDPLATVVSIFERHYPGRNVTVVYQPIGEEVEACGLTEFPDDGSDPLIVIDPEIPFHGVVETLAHELAHIAEPDDEHGEKWDAAFTLIEAEYNKAMEAVSQEITQPQGGGVDKGTEADLDNPDAEAR